MTELLRGLKYSPQTGMLYRSRTKNSGKAGPVKTLSKSGYKTIKVNSKNYQQHRLAFLFMGENPDGFDIDHINNNKIDNRRCNLRLVSHRDNCLNKIRHKNKTPYVVYAKNIGMWVVQKSESGNSKDNKTRYGKFLTEEEAIQCVKDNNLLEGTIYE